jgi:hypothetical protein
MVFFILVVGLPVFFATYKPPSCSDGKQNQNEKGVDCGGPCSVLCKASALDLIVHWQRAFMIKKGLYNVVAYVENPNLDSGIRSLNYSFKVYDKDSSLIYERRGSTFVPPKKIFAIFEGNILTGERVPAKTFFEFNQSPWERGVSSDSTLGFSNQLLTKDNGQQKLTAQIDNKNINDVYKVEVVAIVYDEDSESDNYGNAIASSRTFVENVPKNGSAPVFFTWPNIFSTNTTRTELLYRILH